MRENVSNRKIQNGRTPPRRGSVLVVVLVTIMFAVTALLLFIERASTDLMVHVRDADRLNLRHEAYSALETTLAVLAEFRAVLGGLHSPAEGWTDPLAWGDYEPEEGREVTVSFIDESGRIPFRTMDFDMWVRLFESWDVLESDAELWADALLGWSREDYTATSFDAPQPEDYARDVLGFTPPGRAPHSYAELRAIDVIRDEFFDEFGHPNRYYQRFTETISLLNYQSPNINAAPPGVLVALGQYDDLQQELLGDYFNGAGVYRSRGEGYFTDVGEVATVLGEQAVADGFGADIKALRIIVQVNQGPSSYTLDVVVAPPGGATPNTSSPIPEREDESPGVTADEDEAEEPTKVREPIRPSAVLAIMGSGGEDDLPESIEYPFTLLSIQEMGGDPAVVALAAENEM